SGSDPSPRPCLRSDHAHCRYGEAWRQGCPIDPRRVCGDQKLLGRDRRCGVRQDQPERQDGHHPLHGDFAPSVVEGTAVELTGRQPWWSFCSRLSTASSWEASMFWWHWGSPSFTACSCKSTLRMPIL